MSSEKENLVLIHSFPTNSLLLAGVVDYLSDYFNVYFIDLPGFIRQVAPLEKVSFEGYAQFVEEKIARFDLPHYVIGGISFGFFIVSQLKLDAHCRGILALEPYVGADSLNMPRFKKLIYKTLIGNVVRLKMSEMVWRNSLVRAFLKRKYPAWTVDILLQEVDARTFFETAHMLLYTGQQAKFHPLPHVLMANQDDDTVDYRYLRSLFTAQAVPLLIINTTIEHYPEDLSRRYFEERIPAADVERVIQFLANGG